jgi:1-acyl-sn-glycerol-3-phosphate acyltransferase
VNAILERLIREKGFAWYGFCQFLSIWILLPLFRVRVRGRENVPRRGGVLVASNHQSYLDPVLVGLGLNRQIHIMAREGLFRVPGFRRLIRSLNAFPVRRGASDREAVRRAVEILSSGRLLVMFPEGTRTRDGRLQKPKRGLNLLARKAGVPVVPALIDGAFEAWPAHRRLFEVLRPVRVAFDRPLEPEDASGRPLEERLEASWARMRAAFRPGEK